MKTRVFDNNYVGIKLNNVSEIMKYNALSANFSICNESEYYFDEYVEEDDGTGNFTEREPTENEKLERILQAFNDGDTLYATFWLDCGEVVPSAATTLQSDFRVGQRVLIMHENKILKTTIAAINLYAESSNRDLRSDDDTFFFHAVSKFRGGVENTKITKSFAVLHGWFEKRDGGKEVEYGYVNYVRPLDEIFATKEELVKHLMED